MRAKFIVLINAHVAVFSSVNMEERSIAFSVEGGEVSGRRGWRDK